MEQIQIINQLRDVLANSYALYLKTQNYHWNVTGENFYSLHNLFEEQYKELAKAIDEIAERIRMLGALTPASFSIFEKLKYIKDGDETKDAKSMLEDLLEDQYYLCKLIKATIKIAQNNEDEVTIDLMVSRLTAHEKNAWFISSILDQ